MRAEDQTVCVSVCDGIQIKVIIAVWLSSGLQNSPSFPSRCWRFSFLLGFKVLLSFWPLGARKRSYIRTRHSL